MRIPTDIRCLCNQTQEVLDQFIHYGEGAAMCSYCHVQVCAVILWPPNRLLCFFIELGFCPSQPVLCHEYSKCVCIISKTLEERSDTSSYIIRDSWVLKCLFHSRNKYVVLVLLLHEDLFCLPVLGCV